MIKMRITTGHGRSKTELRTEKIATLNADQTLYAALRRDAGAYAMLSVNQRPSESDNLTDGLRDQGLPELYTSMPVNDDQTSLAVHQVANALACGAITPSDQPQRVREDNTGMIFWLAPMTERAQDRVRRQFAHLNSSVALEEDSSYSVMSLAPERNGVIHARMRADWSVPVPRPAQWPDPEKLPIRQRMVAMMSAKRGVPTPARPILTPYYQSRCLTLIQYADAGEEALGQAGATSWPTDLKFGCEDDLMCVMAETSGVTLAMHLVEGRLIPGVMTIINFNKAHAHATPEAVYTLTRISYLLTGDAANSSDDTVLDAAGEHPELFLSHPRAEGDQVRWKIEMQTPPEPVLPWHHLRTGDQPLGGRLAAYIARFGWPLPTQEWHEVTKP